PRVSDDISNARRPAVPATGDPFIRTYHKLAKPQVGHFSITDSSRVEVVLIQKSMVKSFVSKLPTVLPKLTWPSIPLKSNALPTIPFVKLTPPVKLPTFPSTRS